MLVEPLLDLGVDVRLVVGVGDLEPPEGGLPVARCDLGAQRLGEVHVVGWSAVDAALD
ncbi:hypothetical protein ACPZ19_50955 [Amycolatopsis lurida]